MLNCDCGGLLEPTLLESYDFTALSGIKSVLLNTPGYRCNGTCKGETLDGEVINARLQDLAEAMLIASGSHLPGTWCSYLRKSLRLSLSELAGRVGNCGVPTVVAWETDGFERGTYYDRMFRNLFVQGRTTTAQDWRLKGESWNYHGEST